VLPRPSSVLNDRHLCAVNVLDKKWPPAVMLSFRLNGNCLMELGQICEMCHKLWIFLDVLAR
jgi:hypothetical protein